MTAIPGITLKKNSKGQLTHITIDVRQHQEAVPVLKDLGLIPEIQLNSEEKNGHTVEQFTEAMEAVTAKHYENNH